MAEERIIEASRRETRTAVEAVRSRATGRQTIPPDAIDRVVAGALDLARDFGVPPHLLAHYEKALTKAARKIKASLTPTDTLDKVTRRERERERQRQKRRTE